MKKILGAFMCGVYQVFRNEVCPHRIENGWLTPSHIFYSAGEACQKCFPEPDLHLYLTGSSYHLS